MWFDDTNGSPSAGHVTTGGDTAQESGGIHYPVLDARIAASREASRLSSSSLRASGWGSVGGSGCFNLSGQITTFGSSPDRLPGPMAQSVQVRDEAVIRMTRGRWSQTRIECVQ